VLRAMNDHRPLPMAPAGCSLNESSLREQVDRYRRLGEMALTIEDRETQLVVTFGVGVDADLVRETIAIERGCCSFFTLDYDAFERRLSIGIDGSTRGDALRGLSVALRASAPASTRWPR
jgi:hypothetical protein